MNLYLVKISEKDFTYQYLSDKLSLLELNKNKFISLNLPTYKLNNSDFIAILSIGGSILLAGKTEVWIVNIDHIFNYSEGLEQKVKGIVKKITLDSKLNIVLKDL